jgi:hypothetical protein
MLSSFHTHVACCGMQGIGFVSVGDALMLERREQLATEVESN